MPISHKTFGLKSYIHVGFKRFKCFKLYINLSLFSNTFSFFLSTYV